MKLSNESLNNVGKGADVLRVEFLKSNYKTNCFLWMGINPDGSLAMLNSSQSCCTHASKTV